MATAYAALTSVKNIIDTIQNHPRPPISLHHQQIQSLTQTVSFLQQFLEAGYTNQVSYSSEPDPLEMRIAVAAHAAEDVIESHIVDSILADGETVSSVDLYESMQKVIDDMELVKKEAMAVKEEMHSHQYPLLEEESSTFVAGTGQYNYNAMVGFDDILIQILDKLTSDESSRQIISIAGMGGMGKSTLAKNVSLHQIVVERFDIRAWVTVSQQNKITKFLLKLLEECGEKLRRVDECELGVILHKTLTGRRYLIIIDDIWNIEVWDQLSIFLPDNNNGSRILITTRLSNLAREIDDSHNIEMPVLDEVSSWMLFCKHVFKEKDCPHELEEIGKRIVEGCKGLPLSISVVGGLLAKSERKKEYWEEIAENLHSTVNLENDKHCLQILYMSYYNLPVHLKPYFLFMGIHSSNESRGWPILFFVAYFIAEGFVKPISGRSLEEAAIECVIELVERNLILIDDGFCVTLWDWMHISCNIHDLLGDLCLRESQRQNFAYIVDEESVDNISDNIDSIRRIYVAEDTPHTKVIPFLESASLLRSLWWQTKYPPSSPSIPSRLLRITEIESEDLVDKVNLRLIMMKPREYGRLSLVPQFWNVQGVFVFEDLATIYIKPHEIWMMPQLRYFLCFETIFFLPDPGEADCGIILENLHTLGLVYDFKCSEEVVKRIPHIKFLMIYYGNAKGSYVADYYLNNLHRLQRLEILNIEVNMESHITQNQNLSITFPRSLVRLTLSGTNLYWESVAAEIGPLPFLRYLHLGKDSCVGDKWETIEDHFCSLLVLIIEDCPDLENWITESTHFPCLVFLSLKGLEKLEEIPLSVGDIPTLKMIKLVHCSEDADSSARRIKEEQDELGNEELQVEIDEG